MTLLSNWGLRKKIRTKQQIAQDLTQQLQRTYPDLTIKLEQANQLASLEIHINQAKHPLGVLYPETLYEVYQRKSRKAFAHYKQDLVRSIRKILALDNLHETELLLPILQSKQILKSDDTPKNPTVTMPLVDDLCLAFALNSQGSLHFLKQTRFSFYSPTEDLTELRNQAFENLKLLAITLEISPTSTGYRLSYDLIHDSCLLLLPELWHDQISIEGKPVLAVPARDYILVADSANKEQVASLKQQTKEIYQQALHPISEKLFTYDIDNSLIVFQQNH